MSPPDRRVFHLGDFLALDVELLREAVDFLGRHRLHALLVAAQVEEQLALRLRGRDLHHAPVAQDVLVDLGLDPVNRIRHQAHVLRRVEPLHGFHQADVAFLDQVAVRQAVAEIVARDRHDETQVRQHEAARRVEVVVLAEFGCVAAFLFGGQQRNAIDGLDVRVDVAELAGQHRLGCERQRACRFGLGRRRAQRVREGQGVAH